LVGDELVFWCTPLQLSEEDLKKLIMVFLMKSDKKLYLF